MTDEELQEVFRKAADWMLNNWLPEQWDRQDYEAEDLSHDLWQWYLERPGTMKMIADRSKSAAVGLAIKSARQILSRQALNADRFQGRALYSAGSVREALRGESTNKYLNSILPGAMLLLASRNPNQAQSIRSRYEDNEVPPRASLAEGMLKRAVKSLTEEVNLTYLTADVEAIGSSSAVFPDTRKKQGGHSDPTGDTAIMLDEHPEYRFHFYEETPIREFLGGAGAR